MKHQRQIVAKTLAIGLCLWVVACSETIEMSALQRALIACYEDHGIDAAPLEGGAVHFEREGTLTKEESFRLAGICATRVDALGITPFTGLSEGELEARYAKLAEVRECLQSLGFAIPDLASLDVFIADPTRQRHPYAYLARGNGDFERGYTECLDTTQVAINP